MYSGTNECREGMTQGEGRGFAGGLTDKCRPAAGAASAKALWQNMLQVLEEHRAAFGEQGGKVKKITLTCGPGQGNQLFFRVQQEGREF